jgi:flagellar biosynthesis protein FlhF
MGWLGRTYVEVKAEVGETGPVEVDSPSNTNTFARTDSRRIHPRADSNPGFRVVSPSVDENSIPSSQPGDSLHEAAAISPQLHAYQEKLLALGIAKQTVQRWIKSTISFTAHLDDMGDENWLEHLHRSVARDLRFAGPIRIPPGARHTVALIGPTGVGKTTTVAKLAAGFRLESKRRVGLLTIDTFRIAAVQQLRAYAEIIDLPMQVVENPEDMRPAIDSLGDVDLILIDTAGRSPRSDARIDQLVEMLRAAQPDETHLVLSATSSTPTIRTVLSGFAPARPTATILTKLDEAPNTAAIASEIAAHNRFDGIPISYLTNGQQVPDDIKVADVESLLSRLLPAQAALPQIDAA